MNEHEVQVIADLRGRRGPKKPYTPQWVCAVLKSAHQGDGHLHVVVLLNRAESGLGLLGLGLGVSVLTWRESRATIRPATARARHLTPSFADAWRRALCLVPLI